MKKSNVLVGLSLVLLIGCMTTGEIKNPIDAGSFEIQRVDYRTGNASGALLGSVGYLSGGGWWLFGGGGKNNFDRKRLPVYDELGITYEGVVDNDLKKQFSSKALLDIEAQVAGKVDGKAKLEGKVASQIERKVSYHLISITSPDDAIVALNDKKNSRSFKLLNKGNSKSRLITKVIVAYGYVSSRSLEMSAKAGLSFAADANNGYFAIGGEDDAKGQLGVDAETGFKLDNKISLSDGMVIGYAYDILCWEKDANGKLEILTSVMDVYGRKQKCTSGSNDPAKL